MVRVDQTLLRAAILNLAINARNAMPNGGRTRLVALETREEGEAMAKLTLWGRP